MIEISSAQQLALLFPKSNKAISKILKDATPEQLKMLSQAKDLKSVLAQLINDTLDTSKSNKIILDILKNSEFFKELGSFPKEMKVLVELLQKQDIPNTKVDKILQLLKIALPDLKQADSDTLKNFVKDSGVFLESKFLEDKSPKTQLQNSLEQLKTLLLQSEQKGISKIIQNIDSLLKNETVFSKHSDVTSLNLIKKELDTLVSSLKSIVTSAEPLHAKDVQKLLVKLETLTQAPQKQQSFSLTNIKNIVAELTSELRVSPKDTTKTLVKQLEAIHTKIEGIIKSNDLQPLLKGLSKVLETIDIKNLSVPETKTFQTAQEQVKTLSQMKFEDIEGLKIEEVKVFFNTFSQTLSALNPSSTKSIFDIIEKILIALKQPEVSFVQEKLPKDIKMFLENVNKEVAKSDVVFSKDFQVKLDKISHFSMPSHLLDNKLLQENLQKDVKALLLGLEKELSSSPTTQNTEVLKSLDKLLVQVDYFQLLSHLSNASYLYLPYTWEGLENGKFSFKNQEDGSCYCEIDLELKEHGTLNMMLQLFDKNQLNMNIYTQSEPLKKMFKTHLKELREALVSIHIMPRNIHLYELEQRDKKRNAYAKQEALNELGFEVKG